MRRRRSGFTLIELLVVVGIIAILLAILLPTLAGVRKASYRVTCRAQLSDIGKMFNLYLNENKGRIPRVNPLPSFAPPINTFPYIAEVFDVYTKGSRKVWHCPADAITRDINRTDSEQPTDPRYLGNNLDSGALTYFQREGSSYEYNTWINAFVGGDMFSDAINESKKRGLDQAHTRLFNDFEPFHGKKNTVGSTNFLFTDWHVGDLEK